MTPGASAKCSHPGASWIPSSMQFKKECLELHVVAEYIYYLLSHAYAHMHMLEVSPASCSRHGSLIVPHGQLVRLADLHEQTTHNSEQVRRLLSSQCRFSPTVMSRRAREGQTIGLQKKRNTSQWGRCGGHGHHELKQSGENPGH